MYTTRLKKVGGSIMLAVPPAVLKTLGLSTNSEVGMTIDDGCLIIEPQKRPRYSLRPAQNYRYGGPERIPDAVVNEVLARLDAILY
ncbi:AbrB/MazE/SpoVT family DNA-binding domain-containing protein [Citrobacter werkmanii]|uniref:AbrB/MazE/SpoVT family DNA-binding domain-containing protein n=1 Tax=Citrobacter werkmanii TaxID=67827 RepID=UPI00311E98F2